MAKPSTQSMPDAPAVSIPGVSPDAEAPPAQPATPVDATTQIAEDSPAEAAGATVSAGGVEALFAKMQAALEASQAENARLAQINQDMLDQMLDLSERKNAAPEEAAPAHVVDIGTGSPDDAAYWEQRYSHQAAAAGLRVRVRCADGWYVPNGSIG